MNMTVKELRLKPGLTQQQFAEKLGITRTEACFVRVDQNKIWWVRRDGETGYVWIWD